MNGFRISAIAAWIACGLAVVGAIGPWAKAFAITASGLDGTNDGWVVLVLALLAAALVLGGVFARRRWTALIVCFLAVAAGVGIVATGFYDRNNLTNNIASHNAQGVVSVGWGLNLTIVAGFLILLSSGGVWALRPRHADSQEPTAEPSAPAVAPAGWYADPHGQARLRYWDGNTWTESTSA